MSCPVITIANQKGGVGKTTTAINLSAALAAQKLPVLLVDLDPQGNATSGLGVKKEEGISLYGPILGEGAASEMIRETQVNGLSLLPSELDLAVVETQLGGMENYLTQLRNCLAPLKKSRKFKAIILDCPPALGMLSMNGLAATDYLIIALQCEYLAMEGLTQILRVIEQIKSSGANKQLKLGGILMTMFHGRTTLSKEVVSQVRQHFKKDIFLNIELSFFRNS